jgi:hypothetical protein
LTAWVLRVIEEAFERYLLDLATCLLMGDILAFFAMARFLE